MSTTITVRPDALDRAAADVAAATQLLHDSTLTAGRRVTGLFADWQGTAASSLAEAFDEWQRAAASCIAALEDIGAGLRLTRTALTASDQTTGHELTRIAAGLVGATR